MKIQLLPSTFNEDGTASPGQHLTCFVINDSVAVDAGSLGMAVSSRQRESIRDVVISHAHLDHIAGLPLFIDDLFATLDSPVKVHAESEITAILERDIFNWSVYPRFSDLVNHNGSVLQYEPFKVGVPFEIAGIEFTALSVNHKVPSFGFLIDDGTAAIAFSGDTAEMDSFWQAIGQKERLDALLIECAFPNEMGELAEISHHLTPRRLERELEKFRDTDCPIYCINLKPMYRERIIEELIDLGIGNLSVFEVGKLYEF